MSSSSSIPDVELTASGITLTAGRRHLVRDVSLHGSGGHILAIVGRNGAGKTTLLSILSGLLQPDRGEVTLTVGGTIVFKRQAFMAFQPHDLFLYPDLTVFENFALFARLFGASNPQRSAENAIARVGLSGEYPIRQLSRGMQQRAAIGRLLVTGAPVWLLDEPTTGLDERGKMWFTELIRTEAGSGRLILLSSHDRLEVEEVATRILLMDAGRLVLDIPGGREKTALAFDRISGD